MRAMGFETANGNRPDAGRRLGRSPEEAHPRIDLLRVLRSNGTVYFALDFVRHPDEFKRLRVGEAIVVEPALRAHAERVTV